MPPFFFKAEGLFTAADVLKKHREEFDIGHCTWFHTLSAELLLRGYAVECLLKSLWGQQGNTLVAAGRYIGPNDHKLVPLAAKGKVNLDAEEEDVLERLSCYTLYAGCYPIATKWEMSKI
jgi:hypothetical protein